MILAFLGSSCNRQEGTFPRFVAGAPETIANHDVYELTIEPADGKITVSNPFLDLRLTAEFTAPDGRKVSTNGFYYGGNKWMVRFRPDQPGSWRYEYALRGQRTLLDGKGAFTATPSSKQGRLRQSTSNPHRWIQTDGAPYFPIGIQDCFAIEGKNFRPMQIDGEDRNHPGRQLPFDEYLALYGNAGFNLLRFSQRNCSYPLFDDLDEYRERESIATDLLLRTAREHGMRVMFGFFGYHAGWHDGSTRMKITSAVSTRLGLAEGLTRPAASVVNAEKRFVEYAIARWGVYVDFWQLVNERRADDQWTTAIARHAYAVDPQKLPVSTSWERPKLADIHLTTPHWYESENELESDLRVQQQADAWKSHGKPVLVGEHGNRGMNWDPGSARRLRLRLWTALFKEIGLVLWNTSWSKQGIFGGQYTPGGVANIYLGPEERGVVSVLSGFSKHLDANVLAAPIALSDPANVRSYGLISDQTAAVYLHHHRDHASAATGLTVNLDVPAGAWRGQWIEPATGNIAGEFTSSGGKLSLPAPSFNIDLALIMKRQ